MAGMWFQDPTGTWLPANAFVRNAAGWQYAKFIYQKTGTSTWTLRYTRDVTPPGAPAVTVSAGTGASFQIHITAPSASDLSLIRVKVSPAGFPTSTATNDGYYYPGWSDITLAPSTSTTIVFPPGNLGGVRAGFTYYVSVWAQDSSANWSTAATASFFIPVPTPVTPPVGLSAYFATTDSGSFSATGGTYWRTDNNYVYQGGDHTWRGLWFYSSRIQLALQGAKAISKMQVYVQRVNTAHGVAGPANVSLMAHGLYTQGTTDPFHAMVTPIVVGTLNRGEAKWFDVPSTWWPHFISGGYRGLGLYAGLTSVTSPNYMYAYGTGTNSGQVYIQWTK